MKSITATRQTEARTCMEVLADSGMVIGLDLVEVNPVVDERNRTTDPATEFLLSALGRRILQRLAGEHDIEHRAALRVCERKPAAVIFLDNAPREREANAPSALFCGESCRENLAP